MHVTRYIVSTITMSYQTIQSMQYILVNSNYVWRSSSLVLSKTIYKRIILKPQRENQDFVMLKYDQKWVIKCNEYTCH